MVWLALGGTAVGAVGVALAPGGFSNFSGVQNPFGITALSDVPILASIVLVPMVVAIALSAASLIVRFLRAETEVERHQLKWFAYAGALLAGTAVINQIEIAARGSSAESVSDPLVILGALGVPVAIGIAVLRYRLYDIDLVINRTLVYVPLTAVLAGLYIAAIGLTKSLFTDLAGQASDAAVAFTTVVVVALFTPVKNSLQVVVDRYFKEVRDGASVLSKFEGQLRPMVDMLEQEQIARRFLEVAVEALQAETGAVYLSKGVSKRLLCAHGAWEANAGVRIPLQAREVDIGELGLAFQRGGRQMTQREQAALQRCASTVATALALVERRAS
ncbi:MAG: hypothetical protein HYU30_08710 [Chloroflexi bacterium]|nr:hypothetical protein [Chloroflexota bacterium]